MVGIHSAEFKAIRRRLTLGSSNPMFGKNHSEEAKKKMREARLGKPLNIDRNGDRNPMFGRHHSDETRAKIGYAHTGERNYNWKGEQASPQGGRNRAEKLFACPKGMVRHHRDGNPLNNAPENIKLMPRADHSRLHRLER